MINKSQSRIHDEIREYEQSLKVGSQAPPSANRAEVLRESVSNLSDNMTDLKSSMKSVDRSAQLRQTNDRLAKLEQMYVELQQLEEKAK